MLYKILLLLLMSVGLSRPISYPKSWTLIQKNNVNSSEIFTHYSFNVRNSLGFFYNKSYNNSIDDYSGFRWNYLIHRKNTKISQWNIYLSNSIAINNRGNSSSLTHEFSLKTDWETRRYLIAFNISYKSIEKEENFYKYSSRLGFAPYLGKYNDLHTWLILQLSYNNNNEKVIITPILRLFKYIYLLELGINSNGKGVFNFIIRF